MQSRNRSWANRTSAFELPRAGEWASPRSPEAVIHALEQFNLAPLVESQRGAPRISSWRRVYREASELAVRWHRELRAMKPAEVTWSDAELERLLKEG